MRARNNQDLTRPQCTFLMERPTPMDILSEPFSPERNWNTNTSHDQNHQPNLNVGSRISLGPKPRHDTEAQPKARHVTQPHEDDNSRSCPTWECFGDPECVRCR